MTAARSAILAAHILVGPHLCSIAVIERNQFTESARTARADGLIELVLRRALH